MSRKIKGVKDISSVSLQEMSWRDNAACKSQNTSIFFVTPKSTHIRNVIPICQSCPVRQECFYESMIYGYTGIWGGSTEEQRHVLIKHKLNSDLTSFDRQSSDYLLSLVDKIGKTKSTALADILNITFEETKNA
jgi:hypothetical protein